MDNSSLSPALISLLDSLIEDTEGSFPLAKNQFGFFLPSRLRDEPEVSFFSTEKNPVGSEP